MKNFFWLLGLTRCPEGLLDGLPWSAPDTADATEARLSARLGPVAIAQPWFDVDRPEDLSVLAARIASGFVAAPETAGVLARWGYAS